MPDWGSFPLLQKSYTKSVGTHISELQFVSATRFSVSPSAPDVFTGQPGSPKAAGFGTINPGKKSPIDPLFNLIKSGTDWGLDFATKVRLVDPTGIATAGYSANGQSTVRNLASTYGDATQLSPGTHGVTFNDMDSAIGSTSNIPITNIESIEVFSDGSVRIVVKDDKKADED